MTLRITSIWRITLAAAMTLGLGACLEHSEKVCFEESSYRACQRVCAEAGGPACERAGLLAVAETCAQGSEHACGILHYKLGQRPRRAPQYHIRPTFPPIEHAPEVPAAATSGWRSACTSTPLGVQCPPMGSQSLRTVVDGHRIVLMAHADLHGALHLGSALVDGVPVEEVNGRYAFWTSVGDIRRSTLEAQRAFLEGLVVADGFSPYIGRDGELAHLTPRWPHALLASVKPAFTNNPPTLRVLGEKVEYTGTGTGTCQIVLLQKTVEWADPGLPVFHPPASVATRSCPSGPGW